MCGSYLALESGHDCDALVDFTGGISMTLVFRGCDADASTKLLRPDDIWRLLCSYFDKAYLVGCSKLVSSDRNDITPNHAYGVISIHEVGANRFVRVRDPWGGDFKRDYLSKYPEIQRLNLK